MISERLTFTEMMNLETCEPLNCYSFKTEVGVGCHSPNSSKKRSKRHAGGHRITNVNENQIAIAGSNSGPMAYTSPYVTFPLPSNEEPCGWTKPGPGVLSKREKNRLRRREERANPVYR